MLGALVAIPAASIIRIVVREWMATRAIGADADTPEARTATAGGPNEGPAEGTD